MIETPSPRRDLAVLCLLGVPLLLGGCSSWERVPPRGVSIAPFTGDLGEELHGGPRPLASSAFEPPRDLPQLGLVSRPGDGEGFTFTTAWIPALAIWADEDRDEAGLGLELEADLNHGNGWTALLHSILPDGTAVGVAYLTTHHTERNTRTRARTHAATIDYLSALRLDVDGPVVPTVEAGGGVGIAGIDFDGPIDDDFGGAMTLRGHLGLRIYDTVDVIVGGGGFFWGYPGETIGYGAYFMVGAQLQF